MKRTMPWSDNEDDSSSDESSSSSSEANDGKKAKGSASKEKGPSEGIPLPLPPIWGLFIEFLFFSLINLFIYFMIELLL